MKFKLLFTIIFVFSLITFITYNQKNKNSVNKTLSAEQENVDVEESDTEDTNVNVNDEVFYYKYKVIDNTEKLILYSNLEENITSSEYYDEHNCSFLVNGGFYSEEHRHLGLVISDYKTLSKQINSSLFNGFLTINDFETPRISSDLPKDQLRIAMQAGPMIMENANTINLVTQNEKESRRIVAAVSGENKLIFIVIYKKDSAFTGPKLSDLDDALVKIDKAENLNIADSINLDGGSASAFIDTNFSLREVSTIGSFFCLQ